MDPLIQYAITEDDVSIAYWSVGDGPPLVFMPTLPVSHLQVEWQMPPFRRFLEWFAQHHRVIRFDARGTGLSDRKVANLSLEAHLLDVDAVTKRMGLTEFSVFAASYSGPIALRYAARNPDLVKNLILWCTHASHREVTDRLAGPNNQQREAINRLATIDWDLFIKTYLHRAIGWTEGDLANQFANLARNSIEPEHFFDALMEYAAFDATADLAKVASPTLVLHRPAFVGSDVEVAKGLASRIPDARLVLLEGDSIVPFIGDTDAVLNSVDDFLRGGSEPGEPMRRASLRPAAAERRGGTLFTLLYSDIERHTEVMQRLGDVRGRDFLRAYERIMREGLRRFGGDEVKTTGDGFLASFVSAQSALKCAVELQKNIAAQARIHGEELRVRIGINAGEPIVEDDDLFGAAVITASHIASQARGGEILVSLVVRELLAGKGFAFTDRGETPALDSNAPLRLYELRWRDPVLQ